MNLKSFFIKPIAKVIYSKLNKTHENAILLQINILKQNVKQAKNTLFAKDHHFEKVKDYTSFKQNVPIRDYEDFLPYIEKVKQGEKDILWKGKPIYFAITSGTTAGSKYIPITKESIQHHITAAKNALFYYVAQKNDAAFFEKKMIFLQGSPVLTKLNGIALGRLSGIVYHHVPQWLMANRKPSFKTNSIADWQQKIDAIVEETYQDDMRLISGIPPWCIMYFEKLLEKTGKKNVKEIFPHLQLFVYGGVNYEPYREKIRQLIGFEIDTIETFPASEGFFAYQSNLNEKDLLLNVNAGIFYEFVKVADFYTPNAARISLAEVERNINYVLIVTTNAGLWAYNTGDTIKFTQLKPFKIVVTGRLKHFISAFGEHVIAEEVEFAISLAAKALNITIIEFTVAPYVSQVELEPSYHEWYLECAENNINSDEFATLIDMNLQSKNKYYTDLRKGDILAKPRLYFVEKDGFKTYQSAQGKLGGQNKVVHLANHREIAEKLQNFVKL